MIWINGSYRGSGFSREGAAKAAPTRLKTF